MVRGEELFGVCVFHEQIIKKKVYIYSPYSKLTKTASVNLANFDHSEYLLIGPAVEEGLDNQTHILCIEQFLSFPAVEVVLIDKVRELGQIFIQINMGHQIFALAIVGENEQLSHEVQIFII